MKQKPAVFRNRYHSISIEYLLFPIRNEGRMCMCGNPSHATVFPDEDALRPDITKYERAVIKKELSVQKFIPASPLC